MSSAVSRLVATAFLAGLTARAATLENASAQVEMAAIRAMVVELNVSRVLDLASAGLEHLI